MLNSKLKQYEFLNNYVGQMDKGHIAARRISLIQDIRAEIEIFDDMIRHGSVGSTLPMVEAVLARVPANVDKMPEQDAVDLHTAMTGVINLLYPDD